jgi:hypothetical protein
MKKTFALLLCIVLCFYFIPLPLSAADTIQYKAIIETGPDSFEVGPAESVSDAVYSDQCTGVVVYSLDAGDEPLEISDNFDGFDNKTVILSNVSFNGYIPRDKLYLLGNAIVIAEDEKMEITGISVDDEQPKDALTEGDLGSYENLENALSGAEKKYTITGELEIDYPLHVYDLEIKAGASLKIKPSEPSPGERYNNDIIVSHSLKVYGNLTAEEGQVLEIEEGCNVEDTSEDFKLYDSDGNTEFTFTGENTETFDYSADGKWVRRPGGGPGGPGGDDPQNTEYEITVTYSGEGQVEAQDGYEGEAVDSSTIYTLQQGENIRFRFFPDNGYKVSEILADDQQAELRDEYEFNNVTADHILHVEFGKKGDGTMHTITVTVHGSGSVEADGLDNGSVQVEDMFDHMFTFRPAQGWHLESAIVDKGMISEMDMAYYGVRYNEDVDGSFFSLNLNEVSHDITLEITFESNNAEDITFKKYVVTADNNTSAEIAQALAREFGYINYTVVPEQITVEDESIDLSKINEVGYGTFNFSANIGGTTVEDQGYIVPTHEHILFEFYGFYDGEPVHEICVLTPEDIEKMEFGVPAMDSGSIKIYGANGVRLEGVMSSDVRDAFIDGTRNEAVFDEPFYRAEWHIANAVDMFEPEGLNIFGLNMIQDNAFCVQVAAASAGEGVQRTYEWDLNRYAQLTTGDYTSYVFFGNDIFTLRPPESGIGGVDSLEIMPGNSPGYTITEDEDNHYTITFLSDFYDEITLDLLINESAERKLTIHKVGVNIVEVEKHSDSDFGQVGHGTQSGTDITFNGQNNYQLFATYYIPDFGDTAPYGLYVTYTWANGTTTTQIISEPETGGNANTGPDFDGVFLDDVNDDFVSCCDYRLYSAPNKNAAPVKVNVIVLRDNPLDADTFGGVHFGSGSGVEWIRDD